MLGPNSGKEDPARCTHISCPMQSWSCDLVHVRRLEETNKKRRRLVDVAPHWGEPHISCVNVLCDMVFMLFIYLIA
jgi:hypothetical protein